jgi:peptidoglycan/LPS O-acetylase OafA/YrhL
MLEGSKALLNPHSAPLDLSTGSDREAVPTRGKPARSSEQLAIPKEPPPSTRVAELDGVRAIAIWLVLLFHLFPSADPAFNRFPALIKQIIGHGWLGVDLFFVLSGFLITGVLLESRSKHAYFKNFYGRRALRILPVYLLTVLVMSYCYSNFNSFFILSLAFLANFKSLLHIPYPLGGSVLWSLAVEEHFYLLWPVLVRFATTRILVAIGVALVLVELVARGICMAHGIDTYELSWFRFDSLAFGALLAVFVRSRYCTLRNCVKLVVALVLFIGVVTLAAAPFGALIIGSPVSSTLRFAHAYVGFGAGILLLWAFRGHPMTAIFRSGFARMSADLSYCVYLIHLGVLDAYYRMLGPSGKLWLRAELGGLTEGMVSAATILVITFALALLSRRFLETPFLRLKERFVTTAPRHALPYGRVVKESVGCSTAQSTR